MIPKYYKQFINSEVDLNESPKQCCPFHKEDTPSFSYSKERNCWRCFGSCKEGGDIIKLCMFHQKISYKDAIEFLNKNGYDINNTTSQSKGDIIKVLKWNTPDNYEKLDMLMSSLNWRDLI